MAPRYQHVYPALLHVFISPAHVSFFYSDTGVYKGNEAVLTSTNNLCFEKKIRKVHFSYVCYKSYIVGTR